MWRRFTNYLRNSITDIRSCPRWLDKPAVCLSSVGRVVTLPVNAVASGFFGLERDLVPNNWFLLRDVFIVNGDGAFHCRKHTSDVTIVRHSYEHALRKYFVLDRGVFLDIGAHIGKYTVALARKLDGAGHMIAVEPDPDNFRTLRKNVEANGLLNVTLCNVACAAVDGEALLYRDPCEPIKHSLRKGPGAGIAVQSRSIDSLMASLGIDEVNLIKLDVEGLEAAVLEGSRNTLKRSLQVRVIFEAEGRASSIDLLRDLGFVISQTAHRFGKNGRYYVAQRPRATLDEHALALDMETF